MRELPVDAKAICTDGDVGWVTDVVVDPVARTVTHIVVRESDAPGREFLIPLEKVTDSSRTVVQLGCARADLVQFPEFTTTHYVPASSPEAQPVVAAWEMQASTYLYGYEPIYVPVVAPDERVPIAEHHVPPGELAFQRGAPVQSSDDQLVGEVAAFIVRPDEGGTISHFVMRLDTSGAEREVVLPLSAVDLATAGIVRLRLSLPQLEQLPAAPPGGRYSSANTHPDALHLIVIIFDRPGQADAALRLARGTNPKLDAAIVRKGLDGRITSQETHDVSVAGGAVAGAVIGGVLSLVGGPLGLVASSALGGAAGGVVGHVVDHGIPDRYARDLGRALRAGSSALVVLVPQREEATLLDKLAPLNGSVLRLELTDEMIARLTTSG